MSLAWLKWARLAWSSFIAERGFEPLIIIRSLLVPIVPKVPMVPNVLTD
jgi:hypothetical protein